VELIEAIEGRRSVRCFSEQPVSEGSIRELVRLAAMAPSSHNAQPWHFHVATGDVRAKVGEILSATTKYVEEYLVTLDPIDAGLAESFFAELGRAPVAIAVSVPDAEDELENISNLISVGGAAQNFQLAAHAQGLATCVLTFTYWLRDELAEAMDIDASRKIVSVILLGAPAERPDVPPRKESVVTFVE